MRTEGMQKLPPTLIAAALLLAAEGLGSTASVTLKAIDGRFDLNPFVFALPIGLLLLKRNAGAWVLGLLATGAMILIAPLLAVFVLFFPDRAGAVRLLGAPPEVVDAADLVGLTMISVLVGVVQLWLLARRESRAALRSHGNRGGTADHAVACAS